ncbi:unnamed protein product [Caenorhabditis bovis]|uniref:EGF-like domain-containing protein n=1 Tax=Caenorhabditis bovis TaxID=2654633 RepID=A0A8S1FDE1_9PELO|nr:unnamed protein product [Caenorhabditis bovis]
MRLDAILVCTVLLILGCSAERPKVKDTLGNLLVRISDIPVGSCGGDSYFGLGIMEGSLEECDRWKVSNGSGDYEEHKCKTLRVHAEMQNGKCQCKNNWKGPICNDYNGCPEGHSLYGSVCTANVCQHGGELAVGKKEIECICPAPWDGRYCERLACWRKTTLAHQHRYRNNGDHCICGTHYTGENCDIVTSCLNNAKLENGVCNCQEGWHGELCEKRCPKGQVTCASSAVSVIGVMLLSWLCSKLL